MATRTILEVVGGVLVAAAAIKSVRSGHVDLQSRIWLLTGAIFWVVAAWLWSRS